MSTFERCRNDTVRREDSPLSDSYIIPKFVFVRIRSLPHFQAPLETVRNNLHGQFSARIFPHLLPSSPIFNCKHIMSLFKSNKNKSASAATTPAQTPRTSMQEQRPEQLEATKMTREQALETLMQKSMWNVATGPYIR
ncbi:hypothetical protein B0O80DRAFT_493754 [Mortierella sp. GBAus27b]|nr:hypothetical protein B0O80DRAFT_493754 [Mortierella sp. GBAus27b]